MQQNNFTIGEVRAHWDSIAQEYDRINQNFGWSHTERFTTMQSFLPKEYTSPAILNVWSRSGHAVKYLRETFPEAAIQNLEASEKLIEIARKDFPNEHFEQTDLHTFPCENETKDIIISLETLEHVPDPLHFLLECHRTLKVGGTLILSCPPAWAEVPLRIYERFFENHGEGPHRFRTVSEVLKTMKRVGFSVEEHRGTVLLPVGPPWAKRAAEVLQKKLLRYIGANRLGIRHFFVAKKEARDPVWNALHEEIIRPGISMQSGTCIGLSGGTLRLADPDGACLPVPTGTGPVPKVCYDASPEVRPNYPELTKEIFGAEANTNGLIGNYKRISIAHCTDETIRQSGASGGLLTGTLLYLLETGKITGAVVLTMDKEYPWRAVPKIARTAAEILESAQSKYVISPVNTILDEVAKEEGPLAYVGLPHQVFAIRKLQQLRHPSVQAIRYIFGPFFGNELSGSSVDAFLKKFHATKEDVTDFSYRAGEWPGFLQAKLKDGRTVRLPKFHANYLIPFHITDNSLLSHDLTNEFTDLSGGDAWAPKYEERGKGFSMLITRTAQGNDLITEMEESGKLELHDISEEEAVQMQSHGLDLKKRGGLLRNDHKRKHDRRYHQYNLPVPKVSLQRRSFEVLLGLLFSFCRSRAGRQVADLMPHSVIGPMFQWFRKVWKAATKNVKRSGLGPQ
jgi:coenzyme F420 hydrogenase subunit beta